MKLVHPMANKLQEENECPYQMNFKRMHINRRQSKENSISLQNLHHCSAVKVFNRWSLTYKYLWEQEKQIYLQVWLPSNLFHSIPHFPSHPCSFWPCQMHTICSLIALLSHLISKRKRKISEHGFSNTHLIKFFPYY